MAGKYKLERIRKEEVMAKSKYSPKLYLLLPTNLDQTSKKKMCSSLH
jgi:hypothetical protein